MGAIAAPDSSAEVWAGERGHLAHLSVAVICYTRRGELEEIVPFQLADLMGGPTLGDL